MFAASSVSSVDDAVAKINLLLPTANSFYCLGYLGRYPRGGNTTAISWQQVTICVMFINISVHNGGILGLSLFQGKWRYFEIFQTPLAVFACQISQKNSIGLSCQVKKNHLTCRKKTVITIHFFYCNLIFYFNDITCYSIALTYYCNIYNNLLWKHKYDK